MPALTSTLREIFAQCQGAKAVISATLRNPKTLDTFMHACSKSFDPWKTLEDSRFTSIAANHFRIQRLQIPLAKEDNQLGFFFPTSIPILIFMITRGQTKSDSLNSSEESQ